MNLRPLAAALALLALAVYLGLALPARREAAQAEDANARVHKERREARTRLLRLERQRPRASPAGAATPGERLRQLRRRVIEVVEAAPVSGVLLDVQPQAGSEALNVRLGVEGEYLDLARLSGRLASQEVGLALQTCRLLATPAGLRLELEATTAGGAW